MKVWVVHKDIRYDGSETMHICSNRERADALAVEAIKDDGFPYVLVRRDNRVTEWEWHDYTITVYDVEVKE